MIEKVAVLIRKDGSIGITAIPHDAFPDIILHHGLNFTSDGPAVMLSGRFTMNYSQASHWCATKSVEIHTGQEITWSDQLFSEIASTKPRSK